jgi:hypothetical protein
MAAIRDVRSSNRIYVVLCSYGKILEHFVWGSWLTFKAEGLLYVRVTSDLKL